MKAFSEDVNGSAFVVPERPLAVKPSDMMAIKQLHLIIYETVICQVGLGYALTEANEESCFPPPGCLAKLDHKCKSAGGQKPYFKISYFI